MRHGCCSSDGCQFHLAGITAEFLAEANRCRIHQMGATDLHHFVEFPGFGCQGLVQSCNAGNRWCLEAFQGRHMDSRRDHIVAGLADIDMIVGVDRAATTGAAQQFDGTVGDDLIGVHVGRCTRPVW